MADYYKRPPIFQPMPSIAQLGEQNGGANYFGEPGMPPIAQQPGGDLGQFIDNSADSFLQTRQSAAPYQAPDYNSGNYALPNDYQIGYNQNYSNPNDPTSTAFALQQNIKSLATGAASAKQNQKFQKGQHAQDLVRNFLAPLAATFGPNGAAQGVNEYMKTSNERAVKAKEMNLKEQADAITQMKTMADMLKDNNPFTKDQLEQIVKRAKAEQEIRSEQALQAQREQAGKTDAMQGYKHEADAIKGIADAYKDRAARDLTNQKTGNEVLRGGQIEAKTKDIQEATGLKADTRKDILPARKKAFDAAALANNKRAGLADAQTQEVKPLAVAKKDLMDAQEQLARDRARNQQKYTGPADEGAVNQIMSKLPPGEAGRFQAAIALARKHNGGQLSMADLITAQNASMGAHEKMLLKEKANRAKTMSTRPQPPGANGVGIKF